MIEALEQTVEELLEDPEVVEKFDFDGDGELDDHERMIFTRVVRGELLSQTRGEEFEFATERYEDRFEVLGRLGKGGQAETFLALDEETGEPVVVKRVELSALHEWKTLELFEREADVLAGLEHPGIPELITIFGVGDPQHGMCIVQEYVPGQTLHEILERDGPFPEDTLFNLANQMFEILAYIHSQSPPVVHRDIKPANLILDDDYVLHLIDFGAARDLPSVTAGGSTVVGTHGYMPMEQYMGIAKPATDMYAAGATLLQMLTGLEPSEFPFEENRIQFERYVDEESPLFLVLERLLEPVAERRLDAADKAKKMLRTDVRALLRTEAPTPMPLRVPDFNRVFPRWLDVDVHNNALTFEIDGARKFRIKEEKDGIVLLRGAANARMVAMSSAVFSISALVAAFLVASTSTLVSGLLALFALAAIYHAIDRDGFVRIDYLGVKVPSKGVLELTSCKRFEARGNQLFLHLEHDLDGSSETEIHVPIGDRAQANFVEERLNKALATFRERVGLKRFVEA